MRFLGRRHYVSLAVILASSERIQTKSKVAFFCADVGIPVSTIQRWKSWWVNQFKASDLWRAECARFFYIDESQLPLSLAAKLGGLVEDALQRLLIFLAPVTIGPLVKQKAGC